MNEDPKEVEDTGFPPKLTKKNLLLVLISLIVSSILLAISYVFLVEGYSNYNLDFAKNGTLIDATLTEKKESKSSRYGSTYYLNYNYESLKTGETKTIKEVVRIEDYEIAEEGQTVKVCYNKDQDVAKTFSAIYGAPCGNLLE